MSGNRPKPAVPAPRGPQRERGAALAIALVILLILTLIGVTALLTTAFEGKMAGGTQELNRALRAAEAGLETAISTGTSFNLAASQSGSLSSGQLGGYGATAAFTTTFKTFTRPPRRISGIYGQSFQAAQFETTSIGRSSTGSESTLYQGAFQIMAKD